MLRVKGARGFTLVELMIVIALLVIVATIAVPNFTQFIRNNQVQAKADEVKSFLQYARGQAVTTRRSYEVTTGATWEVKPEGGAAERRLEFNTAQAQARTNPNNLTLIFTANGAASSATRISVCRDSDFANGYLLEISRSGVIKIFARGYKDETTELTSCTP